MKHTRKEVPSLRLILGTEQAERNTKEGMHGRLMNEFPSKKIKWQNIYMLKTLVNQ